MNTVHKRQIVRKEEAGFALPSILFLITILSLVALSVVMLHFLQQRTASLDLARVRAQYAAQSGINELLAQQTSLASIAINTPLEFSYSYNSKATVTLTRWGSFFLVLSTGVSGAVTTNAAAIAADHPSGSFDNALVFANPNHQLVCAGTTSITGNVLTGKSGVTTGTLQNVPTPRTLPVSGKVSKQSDISLPSFRSTELQSDMNEWDKLLTAAASGGASDSTTLYFRGSPTILQPEMIAASISTIFINGDVVLQGQHKRLERPLTIAATGNVSFSDGTTISGLVKILAGKQVTIPSGVEFDAPIVYSQTAIELQSNQLRAQFFAPSIIMRANSAARYPSVVVSPQIQTKHPPKNQIMMESGSRLEGSMLFLAPAADTCLATIKDGARIVGSLYSTGYVTLDGSVDGTVITNEFYFYQSPTTYFGWMRSAKINRTVLSKSYLVPPGFSDSPKLDVLDWL